MDVLLMSMLSYCLPMEIPMLLFSELVAGKYSIRASHPELQVDVRGFNRGLTSFWFFLVF
ncbi:hypothetical protein Bca4012_061263 [Brassica carinata]